MGKKAREYKAGDFIFAKVKGYPAWPARVRGINGKKYFVYFYGTGEIANLPPNMIFDYAENKSKFLTKTVKRKDFNDGVKQIEHDFLNNVPVEEVVGSTPVEFPTPANDVSNDTVNADDTMNETTESNTLDETVNTTQNETAIEDSDEGGALVIDEGKKGRKSKGESGTPKMVKTVKELKAMKNLKKDEKEKEEETKKEEEIISRSGRKIRPKRYADEQAEDNATVPTPIAKKKRATSPEKKADTPAAPEAPVSKNYHAVSQTEIEDLKEPFATEDAKEALLMAYLPSGRYVGIKFQSRPATVKNDATKLQWDRQAAINAIKLKKELERGEITVQSVIQQLEMELNLTDEDKANLDKERLIEERKARMQFLKTEIEMVELDAKIKTCLSLEKADTESCLVLLDHLLELPIKSLMLLKHPSILESVKRMRCYVGNKDLWRLSDDESCIFAKKAEGIRQKANEVYDKFKDLFPVPEGLSFWEYFNERATQFKKCTAKLDPIELCQMVHEPLEMSIPTSYSMRSAIDAANEVEPPLDDGPEKKKNPAPVKRKGSQPVVNTPNKTSKRKQKKQDDENNAPAEEKSSEEANTEEESKNDSNVPNKADDNNSKRNDKKESSGDKNEESKAKKGRESTRKTDPPASKTPTKRKAKS